MICRGLTREQSNALYLDVMHDNDAQAQRRLCQGDLFYLLTVAMNRKDINKDWLYERCREVEAEPDFMLDLWAREHYKALDVSTPVWTTRGWKAHGDLQPGDTVFSPKGEPVSVMANTGAKVGADCYSVGGVVAAGDHRWPAQIKRRPRRPGGRAVVYETRQVATREAGSFRLPVIRPLAGPDLDLPVSPYVLGVWLGDGATGGTRITAGTDDADEMERLLRNEGIEVRRRSHPNSVSLRLGNGVRGDSRSSEFTRALRGLGVYGKKSIPVQFFFASPQQRLALLQGLMDTDGSVNSRGTATFVNTNEALVDGVLFLARSLGMRASKRRYQGFWQVSFQAYRGDFCPFRMQRKRDRCKTGAPNMRTYAPTPATTRPVNCIQVEGGEYLAGEDLLPTCYSTIITYGKSIQDILDDPEVTIGLFSFNRPIAKAFLGQIKVELESNDYLKALFPDILWAQPQREAPSWSLDGGITVKRKTNPKEKTVEAWGLVDGQPTSKHYGILVYDDVVTRESVTTPEQIAKVTEAWALSLNLGSHGGRRRYIGTRYHFSDTYKTMMDRQAARPRIYPATDDGTDTGKPVFLTAESLREKRREMGPYVFGCQMLQDPKADKAQGFEMAWIRHYDCIERVPNDWNVYLICDPASAKKKDSDYSVFAVIGMAPDKHYRLLEGIRDRMNLTERCKTLFRLQRKWRPNKVGYEKYGMQADIEHIQFVQAQENYLFPIIELGGQMPKTDRIRRLVPIFEQGRFLLPWRCLYLDYERQTRDFVYEFIHDEYLAFPVAGHDDMLDCISRIEDPDFGAVWPEAQASGREEQSNGRAKTDYDVLGV